MSDTDFKATLNLPQTDFPMKGNLGTLEPKLLETWERDDTFAQMVKHRAGAPTFVLHDGPPYANGHLHAGHALNKILKDMVVKYQTLAGRLADYVPGWDCHGLPIEQAVEKRLSAKKIDRRTLPKEEFLAHCRAYALEFIDIQRTEFKRMGVLGRWAEPYTTLAFDYEAQEIRELATVAEKGLLYRKKKPVYWCLTHATALAEAEVEYNEQHVSPSVYVAFPVHGDPSTKWSALKGKNVSFAIWTTTPWTLPANLAISVNPDFEYVFYELDAGRVLVLAKDLLASVLSVIAPSHVKEKHVAVGAARFDVAALCEPQRILAYASGSDLEGLKYHHVFLERTSPVICGEHVTLDAGTGLVHTAPGHGQEDYEVGLKYGLDVYAPIKNDGRYDATVGPALEGKKVSEANPLVIDLLVERGALLNSKTETVTNSYPVCWRCHNDVIFRATFQWFITLDKTGLRRDALREIDEKVRWVPAWGRDRIRGMLEGRPDWCISRQRSWGVPIAMALCENCDEAVVDGAMMRRVADAVEKQGVGVWYSTPVNEFLAPGTTCPSCKGTSFRRETDILDVWFDSAASFAAVAAKRANLSVPADLYLEGSDQHRGWFHSSLLVATATRNQAPYRTCLTHGFVVDGAGKKMSKSEGNVVVPEDIIKKYGAEVLRLWVASSDYRDDIRLSNGILDGLAEGYRKIRNTLRYALSNLYDFDPAKDAVSELLPLDQWAVWKLDRLLETVKKAYDGYEFHVVYHAIIDFCAVELSAVYFDIQKDTLYTRKKNGHARRSAQTALYRIAKEVLVALSPITSFTSEEAWQHLPGAKSKSVFLSDFPLPSARVDAAVMADYEKLFEVRKGLLPLLEAARRDKRIGKSLEARVVLVPETDASKALLTKYLDVLPELFIVSQVELSSTSTAGVTTPLGAGVGGEVHAAHGQKCPRCWAFRPEVEKQPLCARCTEATS